MHNTEVSDVNKRTFHMRWLSLMCHCLINTLQFYWNPARLWERPTETVGCATISLPPVTRPRLTGDEWCTHLRDTFFLQGGSHVLSLMSLNTSHAIVCVSVWDLVVISNREIIRHCVNIDSICSLFFTRFELLALCCVKAAASHLGTFAESVSGYQTYLHNIHIGHCVSFSRSCLLVSLCMDVTNIVA